MVNYSLAASILLVTAVHVQVQVQGFQHQCHPTIKSTSTSSKSISSSSSSSKSTTTKLWYDSADVHFSTADSYAYDCNSDVAELPDNLYGVLGVTRGADKCAIKSAYHKLAKQYHPDAHAQDEDQTPENELKAIEIFKEINHAYHVLADNELRHEYDPYWQGYDFPTDSNGQTFIPTNMFGGMVDGANMPRESFFHRPVPPPPAASRPFGRGARHAHANSQEPKSQRAQPQPQDVRTQPQPSHSSQSHSQAQPYRPIPGPGARAQQAYAGPISPDAPVTARPSGGPERYDPAKHGKTAQAQTEAQAMEAQAEAEARAGAHAQAQAAAQQEQEEQELSSALVSLRRRVVQVLAGPPRSVTHALMSEEASLAATAAVIKALQHEQAVDAVIVEEDDANVVEEEPILLSVTVTEEEEEEEEICIPQELRVEAHVVSAAAAVAAAVAPPTKESSKIMSDFVEHEVSGHKSKVMHTMHHRMTAKCLKTRLSNTQNNVGSKRSLSSNGNKNKISARGFSIQSRLKRVMKLEKELVLQDENEEQHAAEAEATDNVTVPVPTQAEAETELDIDIHSVSEEEKEDDLLVLLVAPEEVAADLVNANVTMKAEDEKVQAVEDEQVVDVKMEMEAISLEAHPKNKQLKLYKVIWGEYGRTPGCSGEECNVDAMILQHEEDGHEYEQEHEHEQDHYDSASAHELEPSTYYSGDADDHAHDVPFDIGSVNAIHQKNTTTAQPNGAAGHVGALDSRTSASFLASVERAPVEAPTGFVLAAAAAVARRKKEEAQYNVQAADALLQAKAEASAQARANAEALALTAQQKVEALVQAKALAHAQAQAAQEAQHKVEALVQARALAHAQAEAREAAEKEQQKARALAHAQAEARAAAEKEQQLKQQQLVQDQVQQQVQAEAEASSIGIEGEIAFALFGEEEERHSNKDEQPHPLRQAATPEMMPPSSNNNSHRSNTSTCTRTVSFLVEPSILVPGSMGVMVNHLLGKANNVAVKAAPQAQAKADLRQRVDDTRTRGEISKPARKQVVEVVTTKMRTTSSASTAVPHTAPIKHIHIRRDSCNDYIIPESYVMGPPVMGPPVMGPPVMGPPVAKNFAGWLH
jgi:curved DNA-binding protein CbpA